MSIGLPSATPPGEPPINIVNASPSNPDQIASQADTYLRVLKDFGASAARRLLGIDPQNIAPDHAGDKVV